MDKEIWIKLCENDMDAIEDSFFCELNDEEVEELRPRLCKIWSRLCAAMDETQSKPKTK